MGIKGLPSQTTLCVAGQSQHKLMVSITLWFFLGWHLIQHYMHTSTHPDMLWAAFTPNQALWIVGGKNASPLIHLNGGSMFKLWERGPLGVPQENTLHEEVEPNVTLWSPIT